MKKSNIPYNVLQLKKMYERTKILDFDCPIQRRYGMWNDYKKGLLFHSMLAGFVIPPIYMQKEDKGSKDSRGRAISNYSCIDGQHRLLSIFGFMNDEYPIDENVPTVEVDGEIYELAGKKFSELPEEIQQLISGYTFTIYNLEECTDEEIEEMFFRLNNGSGLSKTQIANVKLGMRLAKFVKETIARKFFTDVCHFTPSQYRRASDERTLLQAMMLLDVKDGDYELVSVSEGEIINYAETLHDNYSDEKRERLTKIIDYLEKGFDQKEKFMKVVNIPMFIYMADEALKVDVAASDFYEWFKQFADKYSPDCDYAQYCSTGSIKKEKVNGRISVLKEDFAEYFKEKAENADSGENVETAEEDEDLDNELPFC